MPGPWDGPVRVVDVTPTLVPLRDARRPPRGGPDRVPRRPTTDGELRFGIESWARSGDRLSNLLHHHLRMAKEVQLHMWTSFIERVARLVGGRLTGGIDIDTRRVEDLADEA